MLEKESTMKMQKLKAETERQHLNVEKEHVSLKWRYYISDSNFWRNEYLKMILIVCYLYYMI